MDQSFENNVVRIPKAPGLGLLLERPVFDSYNDKAAKQHGRETIDFAKYDDKIQEFKEREIYQRIFREEKEGNQYVPDVFFPLDMRMATAETNTQQVQHFLHPPRQLQGLDVPVPHVGRH
jgi:hypothetical protein